MLEDFVPNLHKYGELRACLYIRLQCQEGDGFANYMHHDATNMRDRGSENLGGVWVQKRSVPPSNARLLPSKLGRGEDFVWVIVDTATGKAPRGGANLGPRSACSSRTQLTTLRGWKRKLLGEYSLQPPRGWHGHTCWHRLSGKYKN